MTRKELIEKLNEIDRKCIDEGLHFYDLKSLYESNEKQLTQQQKKDLQDFINKNPNIKPSQIADLATGMQAQNDPDTKKTLESLDEEEVEDFDKYYVFIYGQNRRVRKPFAYGFATETEAEDFCNDHDWEYVDPETEFVWHMDYAPVAKKPSNKETYGFELDEKLVEAPQEVIDELIEILGHHGFILDDAVDENPSKSLLFGDIHIQVINPDSDIDTSDELSIQDQLKNYVTQELIDDIHELDQRSNCPITWNFGPNKDGQVTGGLDVMKQYIEGSIHESLDLSEYEELRYPLKDGGKNYQLFRKIENGKGKWAAAPIEMGDVKYDDAFEITYEQARGFEPLNNIGKLSRYLGKKLLPKNESIKTKRINYCPHCTNNTLEEVEDGYYVCDECGAEYTGYPAFEGGLELTPVDDECLTESSEPTDEDWEDFYKLEEEIANVMHRVNSDLDDAQGNIYHDDYDGTRRLTFRFVCGVDEISEKIRKQIINALENYLNKTKFNQFIYIRLYPVEVPVGASYEVIIDAETEPTENLTEASYGGAYDIEDDMFFTKEEIVEFVDDIINELSSEFGKNYFIDEVGFADPTNLYISIEDTGGYSHHHTFHIDMRRIRLPKDIYKYKPFVLDVFKSKFGDDYEYEQLVSESLKEDTVKQNGKWVNKGKEGTHGKFATKKAADVQRRAIWVNWNK